MQEWINQTIESETISLTVLLAALLLGLMSSVASAPCNLPVIGAIIGYSGSRKENSYHTILLATLFFIVGATVALILLGMAVGFIGEVAQISLGRYWKIFAGLAAILFGLGTLRLLPFKFPKRVCENKVLPKGLIGAALFGLTMGGVASACAICCNPGVSILFGVVVLKGLNLWVMTMLASYAMGFSLPLGAIVLGVSFGKTFAKVKMVDTIIRIVAGVLLIGIGLFFLVTI